jgi:hypothetical protein
MALRKSSLTATPKVRQADHPGVSGPHAGILGHYSVPIGLSGRRRFRCSRYPSYIGVWSLGVYGEQNEMLGTTKRKLIPWGIR